MQLQFYVGHHLTGKEWDVEGADTNGVGGIDAYHFGARSYDPALGIWLRPDAVNRYFNKYGYCAGNPINLVDPDGNDPIIAGLITVVSYLITKNYIQNSIGNYKAGYAVEDAWNPFKKGWWTGDPGYPVGEGAGIAANGEIDIRYSTSDGFSAGGPGGERMTPNAGVANNEAASSAMNDFYSKVNVTPLNLDLGWKIQYMVAAYRATAGGLDFSGLGFSSGNPFTASNTTGSAGGYALDMSVAGVESRANSFIGASGTCGNVWSRCCAPTAFYALSGTAYSEGRYLRQQLDAYWNRADVDNMLADTWYFVTIPPYGGSKYGHAGLLFNEDFYSRIQDKWTRDPAEMWLIPPIQNGVMPQIYWPR